MNEFFERLWWDALLRDVVSLAFYMIAGGLLGVYVRALYRRFAGTISNRESFSRAFPLLTLATILVIFVVKSSLALSLGLVGALSIVRFRAAIKEPEEIVYLFFCIAAGLALGAEYFTVAAVGTVVFTFFVVGAHRARSEHQDRSLLLTISGDAGDAIAGDSQSLTRVVSEAVGGPFTVQRLDFDGDVVQLRAVVETEGPEAIGSIMTTLRGRLPDCRISYVNLEQLL